LLIFNSGTKGRRQINKMLPDEENGLENLNEGEGEEEMTLRNFYSDIENLNSKQ